MPRHIYITLLFLFLAFFGHSQAPKVKVEKGNVPFIQRLIDNTPDWILGGDDEVCNMSFSYLGKVVSISKENYFIATINLDIGHSCKNTSRILVYDSNSKYLGNYYAEGVLPSSVDDNKLFGKDFMSVDLSNGIPDSVQTYSNMWTIFEK